MCRRVGVEVYTEVPLARKRSSYGFEKRQKEIKKQKKRAEKLAKKLGETTEQEGQPTDTDRRPIESTDTEVSAPGPL